MIKKTGHLSNSDLDYLEMGRKVQVKMSDSLNFCTRSAQSSSTPVLSTAGYPQSQTPTAVIEKDGAILTVYL